MPEEVKEALRAAGPRAIRRLSQLIDSENEKIAIQASDLIAQRVYGRHTPGVHLPSDPAERLRVLEAALHERAALGDTPALMGALAALAPEKYGKGAGEQREPSTSIVIDFGGDD